ncbi:MAG: ectoine/hydroxyectoine ABC transporter permease subunit EhuD [Vulcanimicrobiota bacterium]
MEEQAVSNLAFAWEILPFLLQGLQVTVLATVLGFALALVLGLLIAVARRSSVRLLSYPTAFVVEFLRSTPLLVQLYFLFYVLPNLGVSMSPLVTGVLGLGLHYAAYTSEVYRGGIDAVPRGQWEAAVALNLNSMQTFRFIILPQAIPPIIPALGNRLVSMFKDTPLLSAITVVELLQAAKLIGADTFLYLVPLTLVGILFLVLSLVAAWGVRLLETRMTLRRA